MSEIVKLTAKDGSTVEFVNKDPVQGGVKDVYFSPDKSYVVAFFRKKLDLPGRERIEKIVGKYRTQIFEEVGGDYWRNIFCWPEKLVEHEGRSGIVVPAYQKCFFFSSGALEGAEKEGKWFASAKNFNHSVPPEEQGDLTKFIHICLNLSRGVRRLHAAGLAHSDLSYKNCLVDPKDGKACIIDVDGLVVPGLYPPDVVGTPDFIAPEVVATFNLEKSQRKLPCRATDLHALAVLIYQYLFHRHPLRGRKVWSQEDDVQERLEMGEKALFIENPNDRSNSFDDRDKDDMKRLQPWCDVAKLPYTSMGPYLKEMFEKAFIEGLHNPSARPSANDWEDAILKTADLIQTCSNPNCVNKYFVYNNQARPACPCCGARYTEKFPIFDFYITLNGVDYRPENRRMVIFNGQSLYQWHVDRQVVSNEKLAAEQQKRVGYFQLHKGNWLLCNQTAPDMVLVVEDGKRVNRPIQPGGYVVLKEGQQILLKKGTSGRFVNVKFVNT